MLLGPACLVAAVLSIEELEYAADISGEEVRLSAVDHCDLR